MGPVVLFQATHKLLLASPTKAPIFVVISTGAASISAYIPMSSSAYGSSKTAVNFLVKVLDDEHAKDGLIAFSISPGWVATDMVSSPLPLPHLSPPVLIYHAIRATKERTHSVWPKPPSASTIPSPGS